MRFRIMVFISAYFLFFFIRRRDCLVVLVRRAAMFRSLFRCFKFFAAYCAYIYIPHNRFVISGLINDRFRSLVFRNGRIFKSINTDLGHCIFLLRTVRTVPIYIDSCFICRNCRQYKFSGVSGCVRFLRR